MTSAITRKELSRGQAVVLGAAAVVMTAVGGFGAWGTYTNVVSQFHRGATAAGVVAAGEGLALVLALTMLGLTMLGQSAPAVVRLGLWLAPIAACLTGLSIAHTLTEAVVYAVTPLAMSGAAEGLGLIARRIVVYRTGVDAEVLRRNADAVQQLAYHRALSEGHPDTDVRERALRKSWDLAKHVGIGDAELGAGLVEVQRVRLRDGADAALAGMYGGQASPQEVSPARSYSAQEVLRRKFAEMDPAEVIRIAHDTHPDAPPAELAALLVSYGVVVDAVQVAVVLRMKPTTYTAERLKPAQPATVSPQLSRAARKRKTLAPIPLAGRPGRKVQDVKRLLDRRQHAPVVYFVRNGSRVKIGTTTNLWQRIQALSLSREDVLLVLHGDRRIEKDFHRKFAGLRAGKSEWFELAGDLADMLQKRAGLSLDDAEADTDGAPGARLMREDRPGDAPQATPAETKTTWILAAASSLPDASSPEEINKVLLERHGTTVDNAYIRTVLSREKKRREKQENRSQADPMEGGYA